MGQGEVSKAAGSGRIAQHRWYGVAYMRWRGLYGVGHENSALHWGSRPACAHNSRVQKSGMFDERARAVAEGPAAPPRKDVRRCVGFSTCTLNFAPCTCCAPETSTRIMVRKTQRGCGKIRHRCRRCQWVPPASASSKRHQRKALPRHRGAEWLALPGRPNFGDSKVRQ